MSMDKRQARIKHFTKRNERHPSHSIFNVFLDIELAIVVLLVCAFVVPRLFGVDVNVVMSASMSPTVPQGSVAYIDENVDATDLKIGDIAVYRPKEGQQVMHRVQGMDPSGLTFKGDANKEVDAGKVDPSQIVGRYMFHIPLIGNAYVLFDRNRVAAIVAVVLANLLVYFLSEQQRRQEGREGEGAYAPTVLGAQPAASDIPPTAAPGAPTMPPGMQAMISSTPTRAPGMPAGVPLMQSATPRMRPPASSAPTMSSGMQPIPSWMQATMPGMRPMAPGMPTMVPLTQFAMPCMQTVTPEMQPATPGMQSVTPGIQAMRSGMQPMPSGTLNDRNITPNAPSRNKPLVSDADAGHRMAHFQHLQAMNPRFAQTSLPQHSQGATLQHPQTNNPQMLVNHSRHLQANHFQSPAARPSSVTPKTIWPPA